MEWYYALNGQQNGPVNEAEFNRLVSTGVIRPDTLVWHSGLAEWQPLAKVQPVAAAPPVAAPGGASGVVCAQCGGIFPPDQVVKFGSAPVCASCKPIYMQRLREGATPGASSDGAAFRYAGFWIRVGAKLIDSLIIGVVVGVPVVIMMFASIKSGDEMAMMIFQLVLQVAIIALNGVYTVFFVTKYGATPGKMACGLKVVTPEGEKIRFGRSVGRFFAEMLSGTVCYIGYIIAAFDGEKRSLHDHICSTRVIYK